MLANPNNQANIVANSSSTVKGFNYTQNNNGFLHTSIYVNMTKKLVYKLTSPNESLYIPNDIYLGGDVIMYTPTTTQSLLNTIADLEARISALENP